MMGSQYKYIRQVTFSIHFVGNEHSSFARLNTMFSESSFHSVVSHICSVYVEKLNSKTGDELLAGNYDSIGKSKHVLRKLSSEAMHDLHLDPDVYASLLKMQANVHGEAVEKFGMHAFV